MTSFFSKEQPWNGSIDMESVEATVYSFVLMNFQKSLFHAYEPDNEQDRIRMTENALFCEFVHTLLKSLAESGSQSKYQKLCKMAHPEYTGENVCEYNLALAFIESKQFLETNVSKKSQDWKWSNVHVTAWTHLPFSKTPLKFMYHKEVPTGGNDNTVNVSYYFKSKNTDKVVISSTEAPNYKQIVQHDKDPKKEVSLFSMDTGMHENPLSGHYFDFNANHIAGRLSPMKQGSDLKDSEVNTLILKPSNPKQADRDEL